MGRRGEEAGVGWVQSIGCVSSLGPRTVSEGDVPRDSGKRTVSQRLECPRDPREVCRLGHGTQERKFESREAMPQTHELGSAKGVGGGG